MKKVLVLIDADNGAEYIAKQVESIIAQKNIEIKINISIDKSTDKTLGICQSLCEMHSSINITEQSGNFGSAALNFYSLIKNSCLDGYDYIAFSDQDDIWHNFKLEHSIRILESGYEGVSSNVTAFWGDGRTQEIIKSYPIRKLDYLFESPGPGCTQVFTKKSFQRFKDFLLKNWVDINRFDYHDWLIYAYYRSNKFEWKIIERPLMLYRQHDANQLGSNSGYEAFKKRIKMIRNGWYRDQINLLTKLLGIKEIDSSFVLINIFETRRSLKERIVLFIITSIGFFRRS